MSYDQLQAAAQQEATGHAGFVLFERTYLVFFKHALNFKFKKKYEKNNVNGL